MEEQKRLFIAIILSIVILLGWNTLFVDKTPVNTQPESTQQQEEISKTDSSPEPAAVKDYIQDQGSQTGLSPERSGTASVTAAPSRTIEVQTPYYTLTINENNATISSLKLSQYQEEVTPGAPFKELISPELNSRMLQFGLENQTIPGIESAVFKTVWQGGPIDVSEGDSQLMFSWVSPNGIVIEKTYRFIASSYLIGLEIAIKNGSDRSLKDSIVLGVPGLVDEKSARYAFEGPSAYIGERLEEINVKDIEEKDTYTGNIFWAGHADRYFISCIIPESPVETKIKLFYDGNQAVTRYIHPMERLDPGKQVSYSFQCFMGPKSLKLLGSLGYNLNKAVNFGWFDILAKPCLIGMNFIHDMIPNYGIAIILLTILIKLIFWPLGTKSYKSMNDMKRIQPLMMEIREKYKDDKQKMNAEVMALYKTYKVNPMGGCLPMLVQMPIFFALYRMLYQAIELRHAPFIGWIKDLSAPDRLFHFNASIPFMQDPAGIPVLTIIMGLTMYLQQKMSPSTGDPTQAKIMMLMPLFMTVIFINFPAGLVLYWLVNNILSIGQQYYIQKKFA